MGLIPEQGLPETWEDLGSKAPKTHSLSSLSLPV